MAEEKKKTTTKKTNNTAKKKNTNNKKTTITKKFLYMLFGTNDFFMILNQRLGLFYILSASPHTH